MCAGTLAYYKETVRVEWPVQGRGGGECVRAHRYTVSKQSGDDGETLAHGGVLPRMVGQATSQNRSIEQPKGRGIAFSNG